MARRSADSRTLMPLTALLLAASAGAQTAAPTAERPPVRAGDEWHFVVYHGTRSTVPDRIWHVRSVSAQAVEAAENGEPLILTPELKVRESPQRHESDTRQLQFPLAVEMRWRCVTDMRFKDNGSTATTTAAEVQVRACEEVRVAAGECDATCWHAPSARAIVKSTATSTCRGSAHVGLVEAQLQP